MLQRLDQVSLAIARQFHAEARQGFAQQVPEAGARPGNVDHPGEVTKFFIERTDKSALARARFTNEQGDTLWRLQASSQLRNKCGPDI